MFENSILHRRNQRIGVFIILPASIVLILIVACVSVLLLGRCKHNWCMKYKIPKNRAYKISSALGIVIIVLLLTYFCAPFTVSETDHTSYFEKKYSFFRKGQWVAIYNAPNRRLWKVLSAPGATKQDFSDTRLPTPNKICLRHKCTIITMLAHYLSTDMIYESWKRVYHLQNVNDPIQKFFPFIYEFDFKRRAVLVDKVPKDLLSACPRTYESQIKELNMHLTRLDLVLMDAHIDNVMVDNTGQIKFVDWELATTREFSTLKKHISKLNRYMFADRIVYYDGGTPGDECLKG